MDMDRLLELIEQLSYLDHEHDTDVAHVMAVSIADIREAGLSKEEAEKLLNEQVGYMTANSVLDDEQVPYVEAFVQEALSALFPS